MQTILTVIQVILSIGLIGLVLIQHGRGADAGAAFGSGASATVFGARGSGSFLSRATGIIAALFFLTSMAMAYYASQGGKPKGLMDGADGMPSGMPVKVKVPAPIPASQSASQSEVPVVPGMAVKASGSDVPAVPVDTAEPAADKGPGGAAPSDLPSDLPSDVPVVPAPAGPDQLKAPEALQDKAPEKAQEKAVPEKTVDEAMVREKVEEPPQVVAPEAAMPAADAKPDAVPPPAPPAIPEK